MYMYRSLFRDKMRGEERRGKERREEERRGGEIA